MALTASEALKKLEQQLTCPVCLERYNHPRTLPCLHSYCHDCLDSFPVDVQGDDKHLISCPVCRQTAQLPDKGVSSFQTAFLINSFLELHELLQKISGSQQTNCENCCRKEAIGYCKQCSKFLCEGCINMHNGWGEFKSHQILDMEDVVDKASKLIPLKEQPTLKCSSHDKPLEVYCNNCDKLVCQLCIIKQHHDHDCEPITDTFPKHQKQIVDCLNPVKLKLAAIAAAMEALEAQESEMLVQGQAVKREIEATVQQLIQVLQETGRQLAKEVDKIIRTNSEKISARKKEADIATAQLKSCEDFIETELKFGSDQQILVMKRQMVERMKTVCSEVKQENLQPPEIFLRFVKSTSILEACHYLGSVFDYAQLNATIVGRKTAIVGKKASLELTVVSAGLSPDLLSCQLSPVFDPIMCNLNQVTADRFEASYCPSTAGMYQLRVQVRGDVLDSPFMVDVIPKQAGWTFTGLACPRGVAITKEGSLVVVENGEHCITIFNVMNGKKVQSYGSKGSGRVQFNCPYGVAVTQNGHIVIADQFNHSIQVVTVEGAFITSVGSKGSQPLQFSCPMCVAAHPNGKIFVTDSDNNRVQVLNHDLSFSHCFGTKGQQASEFNYPLGIAVDSYGMVYIADCWNSRIQKFTPKGSFVAIIGSKEKRNGQLRSPRGLCIDSNDILYVASGVENTVSMFSTDGRFLGYVGKSDGTSFDQPWDITADPSGRLFISHNNEVVTY